MYVFDFQCKREDFLQKVRDEEGEGCNIEGSLEVNKVAGSFHFVPGKSFHQSSFNFFGFLELQTSDYNVLHYPFLCFETHNTQSMHIVPASIMISLLFLLWYIFLILFFSFNSLHFMFHLCDAGKSPNKKISFWRPLSWLG